MNTLLLLAEAAWRALVTFFASFLLAGMVEKLRRGERWEWLELVMLLAVVAALGWAVRDIVRPRWTKSGLRKFARWSVPTTSGLSFVWDVALMCCGAVLWNIGFGPTLFVVPTVLAMVRVVFWRRRPAAS